MEAVALKEEISLGFCLSWCSTASRPPQHRGSSDRCAKCKKPTAGKQPYTEVLTNSAATLGEVGRDQGQTKCSAVSSRERRSLNSCFPTLRRSTDLILRGRTSTCLQSQFQLRVGCLKVVVRLYFDCLIFFSFFLFVDVVVPMSAAIHILQNMINSVCLHAELLLPLLATLYLVPVYMHAAVDGNTSSSPTLGGEMSLVSVLTFIFTTSFRKPQQSNWSQMQLQSNVCPGLQFF